MLDVAAAVDHDGALPPRDKYETNDDAGSRAWPIRSRNARIYASLDYWNDQNDVYAVRLRKGGRLVATLQGKSSANVNLVLWKPGTRRINLSRALASSSSSGTFEVIRHFGARRAGLTTSR